MFFIYISALGQECGCVTPTQYKAINPVGKTDLITNNPYRNFKIINPKYLDYKGKNSDGACVRLTFGYGNISVKKGQEKPKAYIDGIIMDETKLRGILCLNGYKYFVIGRYEGEGFWIGSVYSFIDKPALFEIHWAQTRDFEIEFLEDDNGKDVMNNLKLVEFKKK